MKAAEQLRVLVREHPDLHWLTAEQQELLRQSEREIDSELRMEPE